MKTAKKRYVGVAIAGIALGLLLAFRRAAEPAHVASSSPVSSEPGAGQELSAGDRPTGSSVAVPKFSAPGGNGLVSSDPTSADYDPVAVMKTMGQKARTLFVLEPRDPKWAPAMESRLETIAGKDVAGLHTSAKVKNVECRRSMCNVVVTADNAQDLKLAQAVVQYTPLANLGTFEHMLRDQTAPASFALVLAWTKDDRSVDINEKAYPNARKYFLALRRKEREADVAAGKAPSLVAPVPEE